MSVPSRTASEERLAELVGRVPQMRQRDLRQGEAGEIGAAELEHLGAEAELAAVDADVAEVDEGEQEAAGGGAGEAGGAGHVAERQRRVVGVEGADHGQPALQRLHEIRLPIGRSAAAGARVRRASASQSRTPRGGAAASVSRVDGGGGLEEAGEEGVADGVVVPAAGVDGEVGGGDDVAVLVVDGCGDGAEAVFELLVDECPALAADAHELGCGACRGC